MKDFTPILKQLFVPASLAIGVAACQPATTTDLKPSALQSVPVNARLLVQSAHAALNADDVEAFAATVEFPLYVRSQKWTTGGVADYFILLPGEERIIETLEALRSDGLVEALDIQSNVGEGSDFDIDASPFPQHPDFANANPVWSKLDLTTHLIYFSDVEHIVIFGSDRVSGKVSAIYFN